MPLLRLFLLAALVLGLAPTAHAQTLLSESFETDGEGTRYTTSGAFNDGPNDHFNRTDGSDISNISGPYSGFAGTFFWATEDTDDNGGSGDDEQFLRFNPVDVTGLSSLTFSGLFGAGSELPLNAGDYDDTDFGKVQASFDGGATFTDVLCFASEVGSDASNDPLGEDVDCDGNADGTRLGTALQAFSRTITIPTGATALTLQVFVHFDSADEEFAFDLLELSTSPAPPPAIVINEIQYAPDSNNGDANGDGSASTTEDEFVELVNTGAGAVDISGWTLSDLTGSGNVQVSHTFPTGTLLQAGCGLVIFGGGTPTGPFGGMPTSTASTGRLNLNNGGDTVTLSDGSGTPVATATYTSGDATGQSFTRDPDLTGTFVAHSSATGAGGALFSPGTQIDGTAFSGCTPPPPPPLPATIVINEVLADPPSGEDVNGDGTASFSQDEFVELVNVTTNPIDVSGWTISDVTGSGNTLVRHTFPTGSVLQPGCGALIFGGGGPPVGTFGNVVVQTASTNQLGLGNGGDTVTLSDGTNDVAVFSYGSEGGNNQSLTRDPDLTGSFVQHTGATGSGGAFASPGTRIDGTAFAGCTPPATIVINEVLADPPSGEDVNGDGTASTSQDEFVELVNVTTNPIDVTGWTISDVTGSGNTLVRHTFPTGSVLQPGCGALIFGGGGPPVGTFGNVVVQTASTNQLGLGNGGDTVTLSDGTNDVAVFSYGSEGGNNQSLTRDPDLTGSFVQHTGATGSGGAFASPGTRIDGTAFAGCTPPPPPTVVEIFEIQGNGAASPVATQTVTTENNVVTAVSGSGFFMQTPTARTDGDASTSDGIFVFTDSAPGVSVGDLVNVTGEVIEFFDLTEFSEPTSVSVVGTGTLPAPVALSASLPDGTPDALPELEAVEGMLVQVTGGLANAPTNRFGNFAVTTQGQRSLREPGIEFPGQGGLPVWDGNPELFEINPDGAGLPDQDVFSNAIVDATGPLTFSFGSYQLWPTALTLGNNTGQTGPVRARANGEFIVGSLNMLRFFETNSDFAQRTSKFSRYIREVLQAPDILAVQEVGTLGALQALAAQIQADDASVVYTAFLVEGNDVGGIDVGYLVRSTVTVDAVTQLAATETLPFDGSLLHDRPPLLLEGSVTVPGQAAFPIAVLNVHNRSLGGIDDPNDGARVRAKRLAQAESIAQIVQNLQTANPAVRLAVVGDFNAYEFTDGFVDVVGRIQGAFNNADDLVNSTADLVNPDLTNQVLLAPAQDRYSFIFEGNPQVLDHALTSTGLNGFVQGFAFGRGNVDVPADFGSDGSTALRSSDHDGFALFVGTEAATCPDGLRITAYNADPDGSGDGFVSFTNTGAAGDLGACTFGVLNPLSATFSFTTPLNAATLGTGETFTIGNAGAAVTVDQTIATGTLVFDLSGPTRGFIDWASYFGVFSVGYQVGDGVPNALDPEAGVIASAGIFQLGNGALVENFFPAVGASKQGATDPFVALQEAIDEALVPESFVLHGNYPNPFNPTTEIGFDLPEASEVRLVVYDVTGREVMRLVDGQLEAGQHTVRFEASTLPSGVYVYRIEAGAFSATRQMVLLK
ncbi:MAG: lamin tail domain-containing protein [Bacteroidota bacterium]